MGAALLFDSQSLRELVRDGDIEGSPNYDKVGGKEQLAADAALQVLRGFPQLQLRGIALRDKTAYIVDNPATLVALRQVNRVILDAHSIRMADRDTIIRRLKTVLEEGVHHHIYKLDLKSFYESLDIDYLCRSLSNDLLTSRVATYALERFFAGARNLGVQGIPRGIPLSATVAEYAMHSFDKQVSESEHVYFYARYVDDIVIVTGARERKEMFLKWLKKQLPPGLSFNHTKSAYRDLPVGPKGATGLVCEPFDFLGYEFNLNRTAKNGDVLERHVDLSISSKKISRMKVRVCRSFLAFFEDKQLDVLHRRLQMLTGNFNVRDLKTGINRNVGLFCNYRRISTTDNLLELDKLLLAIVTGTQGKMPARLKAITTNQQRRRLLKYGFQKGFEARPFYNFSRDELSRLRRCWEHV